MREQRRDEIFTAVEEHLHGYVVELCRAYLRDEPKDNTVWIDYATALTELSRFAEAEHAFDQAFATCAASLHGIIFSGRGHLNRRRGNYDEAEVWYRKAIDAQPDKVYLRVFLGVLLFRRGNLQEAERVLRDATTVEPDEIDEVYDDVDEAFYNLGGVLVAQERYDEAARAYERALEIDPRYEVAELRLRDVIRILGDDYESPI